MPAPQELVAFSLIQISLFGLYCLLIYIYLELNTILNFPFLFIQFFQIYILWIAFFQIYLSCSNPGYNWEEDPEIQIVERDDYCHVCHYQKPRHVHHCSRCKRCILKMDHHCMFLMNCIGYKNRKTFLGFLVYSALASFIGAGTSFYASYQFWFFYGTYSNISLTFFMVAWILVGLCVVLLIMVFEQFILLSFHMTYLDFLDGNIDFREYPLRKRFRIKEVQQYLGRPWWNWFSPF